MPTKIPYLTEAWQIVTGCSPCSPGCENCYAAGTSASPRLRDHRRYVGLTTPGGKWTGEARCNEVDLDQPIRWQRPRVIGVCFMGDLFHPDVPFSFLDKVFAVMAVSSQHTFVICTKRAERMREYLSAKLTPRSVANATAEYADTYPTCGWPLPNVHLGVTCESQEQTGRVIDLVATPAAHRWVSYEPALGPLDIETWLSSCEECGNAGSSALFGHRPPGDGLNLCRDACDRTEGPGIDGVIIGCESGPNRRPCDLAWVRQVVGDCQAGGVECYVKQLDIDGKVVTDMAKFPKWARVRQLPWMTESEAT